MTDALPGGVTVGRREVPPAAGAPADEPRQSRVTFSAAVPCGVRSCPNCGIRLQAEHREDVRGLVERAQGLGWSVRMMTLTIRHRSDQTLADLLDALLACWKGLTEGGAWTRAKKKHGLRATLRVVECKHGDEHGWHPHIHVLLFFEPVDSAPDFHVGSLYAFVLQRWSTLTTAAGVSASVDAQDMREVGDEHIDTLAGYFTKENEWDISWEVTAGDLKSRPGSRSPAALLKDAIAGDARSLALFREYEQATKGRRLFEPPRNGVRTVLAAAERVRAEAVSADPAAAEPLVHLGRDEFQEFARRQGLRTETAIAVETGTAADVLLWWLHDHGIEATLAGPPKDWRIPDDPGGWPEPPPGSPAWLAVV